jgi:hypothetical protein
MPELSPRYFITLRNRNGAIAWTGDFETEQAARDCLANAEIAASEIGGRVESDPPLAPVEESAES